MHSVSSKGVCGTIFLVLVASSDFGPELESALYFRSLCDRSVDNFKGNQFTVERKRGKSGDLCRKKNGGYFCPFVERGHCRHLEGAPYCVMPGSSMDMTPCHMSDPPEQWLVKQFGTDGRSHIRPTTFRDETSAHTRRGIVCDMAKPMMLGDGHGKLHSIASVKDYTDTHDERLEQMKLASETGNVVLTELTGDAKLFIEGDASHVASMGWNSTRVVVDEASRSHLFQALNWVKPTVHHLELECSRTIKFNNPLIVIANWYPGNFGHFLHDTLPILFWIKKFRAPLQARFGLLDTPLHRRLLQWLDPKLYADIEWLELGKLICFGAKDSSNGARKLAPSLVAVHLTNTSKIPGVWGVRTGALVENLALEIERLQLEKQSNTTALNVRTVVFYSRTSNSTFHGRTASKEHEAYIIDIILTSMAEFKRPEQFVIFNGEDKNGQTLGFQAQYDVFRSANIVIGPHGSGLANILWMQPAVKCTKAPKVLEIMCTKDTTQVQPGCPGKTYWSLLGGVPWVKYYHMQLARNSSGDPGRLFVEGPELKSALKILWNDEDTPTPKKLPQKSSFSDQIHLKSAKNHR